MENFKKLKHSGITWVPQSQVDTHIAKVVNNFAMQNIKAENIGLMKAKEIASLIKDESIRTGIMISLQSEINKNNQKVVDFLNA